MWHVFVWNKPYLDFLSKFILSVMTTRKYKKNSNTTMHRCRTNQWTLHVPTLLARPQKQPERFAGGATSWGQAGVTIGDIKNAHQLLWPAAFALTKSRHFSFINLEWVCLSLVHPSWSVLLDSVRNPTNHSRNHMNSTGFQLTILLPESSRLNPFQAFLQHFSEDTSVLCVFGFHRTSKKVAPVQNICSPAPECFAGPGRIPHLPDRRSQYAVHESSIRMHAQQQATT